MLRDERSIMEEALKRKSSIKNRWERQVALSGLEQLVTQLGPDDVTLRSISAFSCDHCTVGSYTSDRSLFFSGNLTFSGAFFRLHQSVTCMYVTHLFSWCFLKVWPTCQIWQLVHILCWPFAPRRMLLQVVESVKAPSSLLMAPLPDLYDVPDPVLFFLLSGKVQCVKYDFIFVFPFWYLSTMCINTYIKSIPYAYSNSSVNIDRVKVLWYKLAQKTNKDKAGWGIRGCACRPLYLTGRLKRGRLRSRVDPWTTDYLFHYFFKYK